MTTQHDTSLHRTGTLSRSAHQLYKALIDEVIATGNAPRPVSSEALDELVQNDWLVVDDRGYVDVLYPFSPSPTAVEVRFKGHDRYAMCATDALGLAPMLGCDVEITTSCPQTGVRLQISVSQDGAISSSDPDVAVLRRRQAGAAHISRCGATRFFQSSQAAAAWHAEHGAAGDVVLSLADAYAEAATMFGRCYSDGMRVWL